MSSRAASSSCDEHRDEYLIVDQAAIESEYREIRKGRLSGTLDPRFLKKVCVAGTAALKILGHAQAGILQGINDRERGMPLEVLGVLSGHLSTSRDTLIVTDAFPVPAKGGAHSVQEDPRTTNHMLFTAEDIALVQPGDSLVGWYHSHPFDPDDSEYGHCWFSATDVQTQNGWQGQWEMGDGIPFVGLVVDPMNSLQRNQLMIGAFRNYPPDYNGALEANVCPDGKVLTDDTKRHKLWGQSWSAYYRLELELFTTSMMANVMQILQKDAMWSAALSQSRLLDPAFERLFPARVDKIVADLQSAAGALSRAPDYTAKLSTNRFDAAGISFDATDVRFAHADEAAPPDAAQPAVVVEESQLVKVDKASTFLAFDFIHAQLTQNAKSLVFQS